MRRGQSSGAGSVGHGRPLPVDRQVLRAERCVDREDLTVPDVADDAHLAGALAGDGDGHVEIHDRVDHRERQVLRGGPHDRTAAHRLHRGDRCAQPAPAEEEAAPGGDPLGDRQVPAVRVVGRPETQELCGVHPRRRYGRAGGPASSGTVTHARNGRPGEHDDRHTMAGRRLFARGRVPGRGPLSRRGARRDHRCHRRERAERVQLPRPGARPGEGARGRRVPAVRRGPVRGQGTQQLPGVARHRGVAGVRRPPRRSHRDRAGARRARRRRRPRGADDRVGVRRAQREHHEAERRHPQPVAARPHRRRVVGRQRRRGGRWARDPRLGRGRRRVDPHPGRFQRPTGHEGQRRPAPARTVHRDPSDDRRGRA